MKKEYESPAVELMVMEATSMLAASETLEITDDPTNTVDSRQLPLLNMIDE